MEGPLGDNLEECKETYSKRETSHRTSGGSPNPLAAHAIAALTAFRSGDYSTALETLQKLLKQKDSDSKILHNLQLVEERIDREAGRTQEAKTKFDGTNDHDHPLWACNDAIGSYRRGQFATSLSIAEGIHREPLEEHVVISVSFLLLELYVRSRQPEKAFLVVSLLEKQLPRLVNDEDSRQPSGTQEFSLGWEVKGSKAPKMPPSTFRFHLFLFKAKAHLLSGNIKDAKRSVKSAIRIDENSLQARCIKANLEFEKRNFSEAERLVESFKDNSQLRIIYLNNYGCINHGQKKHGLASYYFKRALKEQQSQNSKKCVPINNARTGMLYNLGLQSLHLGDAETAFVCFREAATQLHHRPQLWVRLAECYRVQCDREQQEQQTTASRVTMKGSGKCRRALIHMGESRPQTRITSLTIDYAIQCCNVALNLIARRRQCKEFSQQSTKLNRAAGEETMTSGGKPSDQATEHHALTMGAYLALENNDPMMAAHYSRRLLSLFPSLELKTLGCLYLSEALCKLNDVDQATSTLKELLDGLTEADDPADFRKAILVNMAVVQLLRQEWDLATTTLHKLGGWSHPHVLLAKTYLLLCRGEKDEAVALLANKR